MVPNTVESCGEPRTAMVSHPLEQEAERSDCWGERVGDPEGRGLCPSFVLWSEEPSLRQHTHLITRPG